MDLSKLNQPKVEQPEDRPIESAHLLGEDSLPKNTQSKQGGGAIKRTNRRVGRPSTKQVGVVYKKAWYDLPEDLLREAKKYQVLNDYATNSELVEAALRKFINYNY